MPRKHPLMWGHDDPYLRWWGRLESAVYWVALAGVLGGLLVVAVAGLSAFWGLVTGSPWGMAFGAWTALSVLIFVGNIAMLRDGR